MRLRYGQDDGRGAPVLNTRLPRLIEPKSLSGYNDVVAYNRRVSMNRLHLYARGTREGK